ncbi:MAG: hypothetical protein LBU43_00880 [Candidatus Accumulibacter sp.]|jgi:predicted Fe-Mo cluster-binding NifX family protein|nr:hypothetical protein [Accumulibacter sp.]
MKLCVPVRVPGGIESCVEPHLPHAEHLLFFDTETRAIRHVALREYQYHGDAAEARPFDAVLCASFDQATKDALAEKEILAFGTDARTAGEAIAEFETAIFPSARPETCDRDGHRSADVAPSGDGKRDGQGGCGGCRGGHDRHQDAISRKMRADALRIAVSSQNRESVTDHAGRCRQFWVYEIRGNEIDNKTLRELTLEQTLYASPLGDGHPLDDVHVMIVAGMSPFLYQRLQRGGIRPFVTEETDPDKAVRMLLERVARV